MTSKNDETKCQYKEVFQSDERETEVEVPQYGVGVRHVQVLLLFLCKTVSYVVKAQLGVTIIAMTDTSGFNDTQTEVNVEGNFTKHLVNFTETSTFNLTVQDDLHNIWDVYRTYAWPKRIQEMVLASFTLGYGLMMFPMGVACQRHGGKLMLQIALLFNGLCSVPIPWLTVWGGWRAVCVCRFLQGASQAGVYPGVHRLLATWVPRQERGRHSCYVYTGTTLGTVVAFQLGGALSASTWGWPAVFWVTGLLCFVAFLLLTLYGADSPLHTTITDQEKTFITGKSDDSSKFESSRSVPWRRILSSSHVWGGLATHVGTGVSFMFCFVQIPTYVHHVLGLSVKTSGVLSSVPYIANVASSIGFGLLSDYCTNKNILSVKNARRLFNSIAEVTMAVCLAVVCFTTDPALAIALFVVSKTAYAASHAGGMLNYIDLSPTYSGVLMATGNALMNVVLLLVSVLVSCVIVDMSDQRQWRAPFLVVATGAFLTNLVFVALVSGDTQPWDAAKQPLTRSRHR